MYTVINCQVGVSSGPVFEYFDKITKAGNCLYNATLFRIRQVLTLTEKPPEKWTDNEREVYDEILKALPLMDKGARKFVRFFLAGAASVEVDKQGRILIPSVLREFAALDKEVALVGVGGRIEIWSKERWEETSEYDDMDDIAEHMSELGLML